jgi:hypothetical protein
VGWFDTSTRLITSENSAGYSCGLTIGEEASKWLENLSRLPNTDERNKGAYTDFSARFCSNINHGLPLLCALCSSIAYLGLFRDDADQAVADRLSPHLCQASHTQGGKARVEHQPVIRFSVGLKDLVSIV